MNVLHKKTLAEVINIDTARPNYKDNPHYFSNNLSETPSLTEQTQDKYISTFIDFLKSDEEACDINSNSQSMLLTQVSQFNAQVPIPEFAVENDGTLSMIWYGKKGSFILAFNGELKQKEYSMLCENHDSSFGILSCLEDILFYLSKIK
mgnify:FL=1|jgi:hypothetical protein